MGAVGLARSVRSAWRGWVLRLAGGAALLLATAVVRAAVAPADALLDEFLALQSGSFTSAAQAKQDARYDVVEWHIAEIWPRQAAGERWIYTESWMAGATAPYMQRISRLRAEPDGTISARRYSLPEAARFAGGWQDPARFATLRPADLEELAGCDALIVRAGAGRFEGTTHGNRCRNGYKGASYAISQSVLTATEMVNWDRGFDATGTQEWGPAAGGYRFRRAGAAAACDAPVRMLVYGTITDRKAFGAYVRAIAESGLYPRNGGWYEAISPAVDVFEGTPPAERGVVIARFPCLEAARSFWHSPEYAEIRKLREGIAEFEVLVLPAPPIPKGTP
jgi:CpeT protein